MNSLRPLITITILAVVGAWLYVKINEGPARPAHGEPAAWQDQTAEGVPPLTATTTAVPADASTAPMWPNANATAPPTPAPAAPTNLQPAPAAASATGLPDVPAIPDLPDVPASSDSTPPATAASTPSGGLPANIPSATYPGEVAGSDPAASAAGPAADSAGSGSVAAPQAALPSTADHESTIATDNAMAAVGLTPQSPPIEQPVPGADRYGLGATNSIDRTLPDASMPPVEPTFADAWVVIQTALDRGELARAHQLLSKWYGDDSLTPTEAEKLETLLSQLAGTVVYSTEHQLEPAYSVRPGDTLESIANSFNVPWQLLAKINGISSANAIQPGQQLKVVRGPFSAIVDLDRKELVLMLDKRYAGKFSITPPDNSAANEGAWVVVRTFDVPQQGKMQRSLVLQRLDAANVPAQPAVVLGAVSSEQLRQQGVDFQEPVVGLSPIDAEDVADILSIGSRVVIRR